MFQWLTDLYREIKHKRLLWIALPSNSADFCSILEHEITKRLSVLLWISCSKGVQQNNIMACKPSEKLYILNCKQLTGVDNVDIFHTAE